MNVLVGDKKFFLGAEGANYKLVMNFIKNIDRSNMGRVELCNDELSMFVSKIESAIDMGLTNVVNTDFRLTDVQYKGNTYQISLSGRTNTDLYFLIKLYEKIAHEEIGKVIFDLKVSSPSQS